MDANAAAGVAEKTTPNDVAGYALAVAERARSFLRFIAADALDVVPPEEPYASYDPTPGYVEQVAQFKGWPAWRFLASPATGHCRGHLGELELIKQLLRSTGSG